MTKTFRRTKPDPRGDDLIDLVVPDSPVPDTQEPDSAVPDSPLGPMIGGFHGIAPKAARPAVHLDWVASVRNFARVSTVGLPLAALCLAVSTLLGWPQPAKALGTSPALWLLITLIGLLSSVLGALALTALLAATSARRWALAGSIFMLTGVVVLTPVLGLLGLARPAVTALTTTIGAKATGGLEQRFFDTTMTRWLTVGGLILIAAGWVAVGGAVVISDVLKRADGLALLGAVALSVFGAYLGWQFMLVLAGMVALAGGLGVTWSAWRLRSDGTCVGDD